MIVRMNEGGENNIKPPLVTLRSARLNNVFTLGVESQSTPSSLICLPHRD